MAKKKTTAKKDTNEVSDEDIESQLLGDDDGEAEVKPEDELDDDLFSDLEEEEIEIKDYEYVKARLLERENNLYKVEFLGVSHGFLNYIIEKLLKVESVEFAAYKETSLSPPILTVKIIGKKTIKKAIQEAVVMMKTELKSLKKEIKASIK